MSDDEPIYDVNDLIQSEEAFDLDSLCEKTLYEALKGSSRLYHTPKEYYTIFPDDANIDNGVSENFFYFPHGRRLHEIIANEHHLSVSRILRIESLQGLAIFNRGIGEGIKEKFMDMSKRIKANDDALFESIDRINCNVDLTFPTPRKNRSTFQIEKNFSRILSSYATMCCLPKDKLNTVFQMYSLRTEPDLHAYIDIFNKNIEKFESRQIFKEEQVH
jgi:hypothetical protein